MNFEISKNRQCGISTLEIMIAMVLLILCLTAVMSLSFGNQSVITDSQTSGEALHLAQGMLEQAQANARKDFNLVNGFFGSQDIYQKQVTIAIPVDPATNKPDYFTKEVTAKVSWTADHNRVQNVQFSARVTNFNNANGGDTCNSSLDGNWIAPVKVENTDYNFGSDLINDPAGFYPITDIEAYKGKLYVAVNNPGANSNKTFFIFDVSNQSQKPQLLGNADNAIGIAAGLNAVAIGEHLASGRTYAYVANGYGAPFTTCVNTDGSNSACGQMQVLDVTDPSSIQLKYTLKMPGVTGSSGQSAGSSVFYKDGYVYLGLVKTLSGPEFHIIDVHNPLQPVEITGENFSVGNTINAILVRGRFAYIASPNSEELKILDLTNFGNPAQVGGYDAAAGSGNGKSIFGVGDKIYLGRTLGDTEFFILDASVPATAQLPLLGQKTDVNDSVNSLLVRDYLSFLLTNNQLKILRTDDLANISDYSMVPLSIGARGETMDCEGNYIYIGANSASQSYLTVLTGQ